MKKVLKIQKILKGRTVKGRLLSARALPALSLSRGVSYCGLLCCVLLAIGIASPASSQDAPAAATPDDDVFMAAAATAKITPPVGSIMGNSYGITVAEGVHDDLYAKTLVFDHAGVRGALIALDMISIPHEIVVKTRDLIARQSGIAGNNVIMTATHLHAGPQMNPLFWDAVGGVPKQKSAAYLKTLPSVIARSVHDALAKLEPVRVSVGRVHEREVNFNRRYLMKDGSFRMNPGRMNPNAVRPVGPVDPELSVVYIESLDSKPVAILVNFALHVAVVSGKHLSSDFPGKVSKLLADVMGDEMVTIFTNGTSGNVNHLDVMRPEQPSGQEEASRIGIILAADVLKALRSLHSIKATSLNVRTETVPLPAPHVDASQIAWAKKVMTGYGKPGGPGFQDVVSAWRILDLDGASATDEARHATTTTVPLIKGGGALKSEIQVMTIGNELALVGFPGDAFVELGLAVKLNSPFPYTIISEQSGNGTLSYVPNRKAFNEKGYEVASARFLPGGGELLVNAAVRNLIELYPYQREAADDRDRGR